MDKEKLFDKLDEELNHYCRFTCDKKTLIETVEVDSDAYCEECEEWIKWETSEDVEIDLCKHYRLKDFVETLKREIQIDKL